MSRVQQKDIVVTTATILDFNSHAYRSYWSRDNIIMVTIAIGPETHPHSVHYNQSSI